MSIKDRKAAIRAEALARRAALDVPGAGEALRDIVLGALPLPPGSTVAGVWKLPGELDLGPLLHALHGLGHVVVLPETPARGLPLIFRVWRPGCVMVRERFGTWRPDGPVATPSHVFVPLVAFDRAGRRLGYGGGYYDRTLAALPWVQALGYGFSGQEVPEVPVEPHDRALSVIVTEREIIRCGGLPAANISA